MLEEELLSNFYIKLCDITNELFSLGEKISKTSLVRKIVRSLPERFSQKLIPIEETKDLDTMKVEGLIGSLRAFEMNLKQRKRKKSISLKSIQERLRNMILI